MSEKYCKNELIQDVREEVAPPKSWSRFWGRWSAGLHCELAANSPLHTDVVQSVVLLYAMIHSTDRSMQMRTFHLEECKSITKITTILITLHCCRQHNLLEDVQSQAKRQIFA